MPFSPTLPILTTCDALIVGGSFGGTAAALSLAKAGRRVLLVEPRTYLGREMTATLRPWINFSEGQSLPALLESTLVAAGSIAAGGEIRPSEYPLNMDAVKLHLEEVLLKAGVKILYASLVTDVLTSEGKLQGVVIGNKSGRQVILCNLLVDTSETALIARLAGEIFESVPVGTVSYRRTLEFDNVKDDLLDVMPRFINDLPLTLHKGYREKGHVLVECVLDLPYASADGFDLSVRETQARHQSMALVAQLIRSVPAFEGAYLSSASYELHGMHTPRLAGREFKWTRNFPSDGSQMTAFAGSIPGVWYLNEAVPLETLVPEAYRDLASITWNGDILGSWLSEHWDVASSKHTQVVNYQDVVNDPQLLITALRDTEQRREPYSPQRGRKYPRIAVTDSPLPELRQVDVLVVGGGTSGATAAITAGREGMRTAIIEMNPGLGGTGTYGGVHSYWFGRRRGFSEKTMNLVDEMHIQLQQPRPKGLIPKWNIEAKAYALLNEAEAQGVDLLSNAFVIGTVVDGDAIRGVIVATRFGPALIRAKVIIDASGDGDVAAFAGADYVYGHDRDHICMWYALAQFPRPGLTRNHFTSMVDVSNIEDYTRAILAGRRRGSKEQMHDHGVYIAPRESRHIQADLVLTLTDQIRQRKWEDVVNIPFSNHDVKGHTGSDWLRIGLIPPNLDIEIPYRALLPRGFDNILVVGKAISATHDALPAIRMQADLENLGGVAAVAAAQAVNNDLALRDIDLQALQQRLVDAEVLPPEVLTRKLEHRTYTDDELRQLIDAMPSDQPLYAYSDMELTDLFTDTIPLVELTCAGEQVIPLLEEALNTAEGARKTLLAQALALVGSNAGVPTLINAIMSHLQGDRLPEREAHIRYTQLPPDHGAMPEVVYLLYSLGMAADIRALPVMQRVVDLLARANTDDFYEEMPGVFYYVDAVCYIAERIASAELIPLLRQMHRYTPFHSQMRYEGFQPDYIPERLAYLELVIGRTLARCGSSDGYVILISYLNDNRALLAEHAHTELVAITGEDFGKDTEQWANWLEVHGDDLPRVPYQQPTEPVRAWGQPVLREVQSVPQVE
jgi:flavin-dependent dehydrogenase